MVRIALFMYLGVAVLLFSLQARLIFVGAETQGRPRAAVRPRPGTQLLTLTTARGDRVAALFGAALTPEGQPHAHPEARPTILYFYGNAMCLSDASEEFEHFRRLGANVLIPEYVGYGLSGGKPGEQACYDTADAAYDHLLKRRDVDPSRIVAMGWSLGGAVALDLASRRRVAGLATFSTFSSMVEMARRNFPFLPASLLLRHRFDNTTKIASVSCPILIGHGRQDKLIPYAMSDRLAAAAKNVPVSRLTIEDADHNDFFAVGGDKVFNAIAQFLDELPPAK
jgi:fermentation-respiration switch protein FrsA (DUF1100 family)